jgi:phospholipid/cholesterol/gamma-HCH transport system substrate-binding protein
VPPPGDVPPGESPPLPAEVQPTNPSDGLQGIMLPPGGGS